jgi:hypothetical protein
MKPVKLTDVLSATVSATSYLNPNSSGGAHTEVLRIDAEKMAVELGRLIPGKAGAAASDALSEMARQVSKRFILKKGKTRDFSMQLVGDRENVIPRKIISDAFGPHGYNLQPTVEKVLVGASEAAREIPYFCCGSRDRSLAPDVLNQVRDLLGTKEVPESFLQPDNDCFLSFLDEYEDRTESLTVYDILTRDEYFKGNAGNFEHLASFQEFVRSNPLTRDMEEPLAGFFDAPITVGIRDVLRWTRGSRHPEMGWEVARGEILRSFERQGQETFLPVEVSYYAADNSLHPVEQQNLREINARVVPLFAGELRSALLTHGVRPPPPETMVLVARETLDFFHDYPIYDIEPYQGVLSLSTLKLGLRLARGLALMGAGLDLPERPNTDLHHLRRRPGPLFRLLETMDLATQDRCMQAVEETLLRYRAGSGVKDEYGNLWTYQRISRTFYSFQENAVHRTSLKGKVEKPFTLEELQLPEYRDLLRTVPELAEKLLVFFTLVYRYYKETGFIPDLRPRHAGRDIFVLGIWGYVSDNLLLIPWRDPGGELHVDLSFVDNRDHFKEFRRNEDRRSPVGIAKNAARLASGLIEPAMLRSIGLFTDHAWANGQIGPVVRTPVVRKYASRGIDIAQEVAHAAIDYAFDMAKAAVQDVVDDTFTGLKRSTRGRDRGNH